MRVSKKYVEELLNLADPIEAISRLSDMWSPRISADAKYFGLSDAEYKCQLCLIFFGEVGNGGLAQYFMNHGIGLVPDTLAALEETGFVDEREALQSAYNFLLPSFNRSTSEINEMALHKFSRLDRIIMSEVPDRRLLDYLRVRKDQVLKPEQQ